MCGGFHNADDGSVNHDIKFSSDVLRTYLRKLYGADFDYSTDIEPTAWREVLRIINEATIEGLAQAQQPPTPEDHFYEQLRHSNEVFSAFKVHSMSQQLGDRLLDSNGKLKPFNKWLDEVKPIASHYVGPWLRTEYNTAVARAHYAADWKTFEANSDIFPNLQWMPTTSPNPDTEHRIFWENKLTRPIDDPFWDKHHPGDRWNCKCTLEPTDEPVTDIPKPEDREKATPAPGLKGNPAKTGELFDKSHPYFPKNCKQCAFNKRKMSITNWFKNEQGDCSKCKDLNRTIKKAATEYDITTTFKKLSTLSGADYIKSLKNITEMKIFKPASKNIYSAVGKGDKDYKNLIAGAKKAANAGYKVYILPNPKDIKSADYIFDRNGVVKMYDLKTITGQASIGNRLNDSIGQSNRVFLNLATSYKANPMAIEIKNYFESNKEALEVLVSVGKKLISVERNFTQKKDYYKQFRKMVEK